MQATTLVRTKFTLIKTIALSLPDLFSHAVHIQITFTRDPTQANCTGIACNSLYIFHPLPLFTIAVMAITLSSRHTPSTLIGRTRKSLPQLPRSKRSDLVLLRQGIDIALAYFNSATSEELSSLTIEARTWADKYYRGYQYATRGATGLLKTFPDLFNLRIEAPLRLSPAGMTPKITHPEAEGSGLRDHQRAERKLASDVEPFPQFSEPLLASDADMNQIIDFRPRQTPYGRKAKPTMRVDAAMLRDSGLMNSLPEFLGQLARTNLEMETRLANSQESAGFELDDESAEQQPHIEMNVYAGLVETQKRRHARRIILPGGRPFKLPGDESDQECDNEAVSVSRENCDADDEGGDSGNETDASTSTTASLRVNIKKRKAKHMSGLEDNDSEEQGVANKLRIHYHHPPALLASFDMKRRELVSWLNPEDIGPDPFASLASTRQPPRSPGSKNTSSSSSGGATRIIKIKVPESMRSSAQSSRAVTPESRSSASTSPSTGRRIIKIKVPRKTPDIALPPLSRYIIKVKTKLSPSPTPDVTSPVSDASSESSRKIRCIEVLRRSIEQD